MVTDKKIKEDILHLLEDVLDPEVPALSVVDLGIIREVKSSGASIIVQITPTYSGCPAMDAISEAIRSKLHESGYEDVGIETVLSPAWSSSWISEEGRRKLEEYGIAPPQGDAPALLSINKKVPCPFCRSSDTELRSQFGATACKAFYYCRSCEQPFEHFKDF